LTTLQFASQCLAQSNSTFAAHLGTGMDGIRPHLVFQKWRNPRCIGGCTSGSNCVPRSVQAAHQHFDSNQGTTQCTEWCMCNLLVKCPQHERSPRQCISDRTRSFHDCTLPDQSTGQGTSDHHNPLLPTLGCTSTCHSQSIFHGPSSGFPNHS